MFLITIEMTIPKNTQEVIFSNSQKFVRKSYLDIALYTVVEKSS